MPQRRVSPRRMPPRWRVLPRQRVPPKRQVPPWRRVLPQTAAAVAGVTAGAGATATCATEAPRVPKCVIGCIVHGRWLTYISPISHMPNNNTGPLCVCVLSSPVLPYRGRVVQVDIHLTHITDAKQQYRTWMCFGSECASAAVSVDGGSEHTQPWASATIARHVSPCLLAVR